jgi:MFS superfamily sulfate permease-like transporter
MQKILIIIGILVLAIGFLWPWISKLPIGRLPGDIIIDKHGLKVYIPITTMILVSVIVSVILWLLRK